MVKDGIIIKIISNDYTVKWENNLYVCRARGIFRKEKISPVVGDLVTIDSAQKVILKIKERRNYLERPCVANVDIALILTSLKQPDLSLNLLDKFITIITFNKIEPVICFSKIDLLNKEELINFNKIKELYTSLGYKVFLNNDLKEIKKYLKNKITVVTGQTGAGKSTLLNKLDPSLNLETKEISKALNRGVHTTRHTELYEVANAFIVDTPGFSSLDFKNIKEDALKASFPEFQKYSCYFANCNHDKEIKCGVKEAVKKGQINESRYNNYLKFLGEVYENNRKLFK